MSGEPARAWQRMLSGRRLDLIDPSPLDVEIEDIAHGLARVARWNGQTAGPHIFSVAQHSLLVEVLLRRSNAPQPPSASMAALLHDAPEYVIGDMISPFKTVLGPGYKEIEQRILFAVHQRFGLPNPSPPALLRLIKQADRASAAAEAVRLAGFTPAEAERLFGPAPRLDGIADILEPVSSAEVEQRFLARYREIEAQRRGTGPGTTRVPA